MVVFLWVWAARVWTSSYPLQPSVAPKFSPGGVLGGGGREVGNPLLSRTLQIRTLEITSREQDRNTLSAYTPSSTLCDPRVICMVETSANPQLHSQGSACRLSGVVYIWRRWVQFVQKRIWTRKMQLLIRKEIKLTWNSASIEQVQCSMWAVIHLLKNDFCFL